MSDLGSLVVKISADHAKFTSDMGKIQKSTEDSVKRMTSALDSVHGTIGKIGAVLTTVAAGAGFAKLIDSAVQWNLQAAKTARTMGITTEQASVMSVALYKLGIGNDVAESAALKLSLTLSKGTDKFDKFGISIKDSNGNLLPMTQIMANVNSKLLEAHSGTERNIIAMSLYGRGWKDLQGILRLTPEQMEKAKETAERLHLIVGPEGAAKARQHKEAVRELELVGKSLSIQIGNELLPVMTQLAVYMGGPSVTAVGWLSKAFRDGIRDIADYSTEIEFAYKKAALLAGGAGGGIKAGAMNALRAIPLIGQVVPAPAYGGNSTTLEQLEAQRQKELMRHAQELGGAVKAKSGGAVGLLGSGDITGGGKGSTSAAASDLANYIKVYNQLQISS